MNTTVAPSAAGRGTKDGIVKIKNEISNHDTFFYSYFLYDNHIIYAA